MPNPLDDDKSLLIVSADLASKIGLSSGEYATVEQFAEARGMTIAATVEPSFGDELMGWASSAGVKAILTTVFMFSVYMAFSHPGTGAPEAVAAASLAVLLGVPLMTGYAEWYEAAAVLLGVALIAVEVFVLPGFGVAGFGGLVLLFGGLAMTFVGPLKVPGLPAFYGVDWTRLRDGLGALGVGHGRIAGAVVVAGAVHPEDADGPRAGAEHGRRLDHPRRRGRGAHAGDGPRRPVVRSGPPPARSAGPSPTCGPAGRRRSRSTRSSAPAWSTSCATAGSCRSQTEVVVQSASGSRVVVRPA